MSDTQIHLSQIRGIEYYDGWIAGVADSGSHWYLVCLVAFDPSTRWRLYSFATIPPNLASAIVAELDAKFWGEPLFATWNLAMSAAYDFFISDDKLDTDSVLYARPASEEEKSFIRTYTLPVIEMAVSQEAMDFWRK